MQSVQRKNRKSRPYLRWVWLAAALAVLGSALVWLLLPTDTGGPEEREDPTGLLANYEEDQVRQVEASLRDGEVWRLTADGNGALQVETGGRTFEPDGAAAWLILNTVGVVQYQEKLAEDLSLLGDLAQFGLAPPRETVTVTYADGRVLRLVIGEKNEDGDAPFYYLTVEGDPALYALDPSSARNLYVTGDMFHPVPQPEIQTARIDAISFQTENGRCAWEMEGSITDPDAQDRWRLTEPFVYSAEGEAITSLRKNLANIRMGSYVAEATPEEMARYGLDSPRTVITVHMAAGTTHTVDDQGAPAQKDWPEETLVFTVGSAKNDMVDYLCWNDVICTVSRFLVTGVTETAPLDTLTRYPVRTSLSNLRRLTVETPAGRSVYEITRTERVAENNELVLDENGQPVTDNTVTRDGQPMAWDVFEARYGQALLATVSGTLPEGWAGQETEAHTRMVFETVTGVTHTISLGDFDAFHDAVWVDGSAVFYLVKGGLAFDATVSGQ